MHNKNTRDYPHHKREQAQQKSPKPSFRSEQVNVCFHKLKTKNSEEKKLQ